MDYQERGAVAFTAVPPLLENREMASIVRQDTGHGIRYMIQLSPGENQDRPKISLGKVTKKDAETAGRNIASLIRCRDTGGTMSLSEQEWVAGLSDGLRKRLTALGIIESAAKGPNYTVAEWVQRYIASRPDVKVVTRIKWQVTAKKVEAFFRGQTLDEITVGQAKAFQIHLKTTCGLAENSVRRLIGMCRQFFKAAIDDKLIGVNPFKDKELPVCVRANEKRMFYITRNVSLKVLDACPDAQWRLIFGLARWGGLRVPSEVVRLKWEDIDFEHDRFTVHASKTEHHADSGIRVVPMFPELRPLFQDAFDEAMTGAVYCVTRYRDTSANLRTQLYRILRRAGLAPWPKLFQNLRSTRETELFKLTSGNVKAVCSWIGNGPEVALRHYAQMTEEDQREAAAMSLINDAEKRVQKTVHTGAELPCKELKESDTEGALSLCGYNTKAQFTAQCESVQKGQDWAIKESNL